MQRAERLNRAGFAATYDEGTATSGPFVLVRVRPNGLEQTRWGFAVGKRMLKRSVDRNRLRRRLREIARQMPVRKGYDVIVVARGGAEKASFETLMSALTKRLAKAGILEQS